MSTHRIKLKKFNELVDQFLKELYKQFPDSREIKSLKRKFTTFKDFNWLTLFMSTMKPFGRMIMERDVLFLDHPFSGQLDLKPYYTQCSDTNKEVIWTYLQTLYLLGCSYENFTPEFMNVIENIAENCETDFNGVN